MSIQRRSELNGEVTNLEPVIWNRSHFIHAILNEFEVNGRTPDRQALRLAFDGSIKREEVDRIMTDVSLHLERARTDRMIVAVKPGSPPLRGELKTAVAKGKPQIVANAKVNGKSGTRVKHTLAVETAAAKEPIELQFDVFLVDPKIAVDAAAIETSTQQSVARAGKSSEKLPLEIYGGYIHDFQAQRPGSFGLFLSGLGDQHVVEIEHSGRLLGLIAWRDQN